MSEQNKNNSAVDALLSYTQADEDGVMVFASRQAIHEVISELAIERQATEAMADKVVDLERQHDQTMMDYRRELIEIAKLRKAFDEPIAWITEDSLLWLPKEHQYGPTIAFPKKNGKYTVPLYRKPINDDEGKK